MVGRQSITPQSNQMTFTLRWKFAKSVSIYILNQKAVFRKIINAMNNGACREFKNWDLNEILLWTGWFLDELKGFTDLCQKITYITL